MNKADSERLEHALNQMGLASTPSTEDADLIVVNSCVVRQSAEDRVTGMLSSLKPIKHADPNKIVALMGCMVGPKTDALERRFPYADIFIRPQQYEPLISLIGDRLGIDPEGCVGPLTSKAEIATYIPIIHGCNKFCTFCIIPYRRGREVCRPIEDVVREIRMLVESGVKEVTLLGQNVDSYGHDLPGKPDLGDLLTEINRVDKLKRIRFLTSHPNDMSDHIIDSVARLDKVCEHINLPFQAGDNDVLRNMRRGYTNDDYRNLIEKIRRNVPHVSLSTDVIVGFSGETEKQFEQTLKLIEDIEFDKIHAAAYSTRPGTIAGRKMEDDIPHEEKKLRLRTIHELQEKILTKKNADLVGKTYEVLVENRRRGKWYGRNRNDKLVYFENVIDHKGELIEVEITESSPWSLSGSLVA